MSEQTIEIDQDRAALHNRIDIEIAKLVAETAKISAETSRINSELRVFPWLPILTAAIGSGGLVGGIVALAVAFHR